MMLADLFVVALLGIRLWGKPVHTERHESDELKKIDENKKKHILHLYFTLGKYILDIVLSASSVQTLGYPTDSPSLLD